MHIFDVLEAWFCSMEYYFESSGVVARFDRSPTDRPNPSCGLNLRRSDYEVDLLVWDSGEAELTIGMVDGSINQVHFDDVHNRADLTKLLSNLIEFGVPKGGDNFAGN